MVFFSELDIAVFEVVEWVRRQWMVNFCSEYCSLCSGRFGKQTGVSLVCGLDFAGCVFLECEERQGLI
jgi:hypothetical protein